MGVEGRAVGPRLEDGEVLRAARVAEELVLQTPGLGLDPRKAVVPRGGKGVTCRLVGGGEVDDESDGVMQVLSKGASPVVVVADGEGDGRVGFGEGRPRRQTLLVPSG